VTVAGEWLLVQLPALRGCSCPSRLPSQSRPVDSHPVR